MRKKEFQRLIDKLREAESGGDAIKISEALEAVTQYLKEMKK